MGMGFGGLYGVGCRQGRASESMLCGYRPHLARTDRSCFVSVVPAAVLRKNFHKMLRVKKIKAIFGLYQKGRMVGMMRVWEQKKPRQGLVGNIGVLPGHRGKGLSSHLYKAGLQWMKDRKFNSYMGRSSTERVLSQLPLMKRRIVYTYLTA